MCSNLLKNVFCFLCKILGNYCNRTTWTGVNTTTLLVWHLNTGFSTPKPDFGSKGHKGRASTNIQTQEVQDFQSFKSGVGLTKFEGSNTKLKFSYNSFVSWLYWCFTALQHFSGHFRRGQLTYPHCSWASLQGSLSVPCAFFR